MPKPLGMAGIMKRKIMTTPWSVNIRLYVIASMIVGPGVSSSIRMRSAKRPPRKSETVVAMRNITPMRLWSRVSSHDRSPVSGAFR